MMGSRTRYGNPAGAVSRRQPAYASTAHSPATTRSSLIRAKRNDTRARSKGLARHMDDHLSLPRGEGHRRLEPARPANPQGDGSFARFHAEHLHRAILRPVAGSAVDSPRGTARTIIVGDPQHRADPVRVPRAAAEAHAQPGTGVFVVIELGFPPVLRHNEIGPAVPVVIGEGGPALIPVHHDARDLAEDRLERAVAPAAQQQPATAIVARRADLGGERSEEHTSELQSHHDLVCRLLLEKKKKKTYKNKHK